MRSFPSFRLAVMAVAALCCAGGARADVYEIDKDHTEVRFTWDHVGMSRQGGRFRDVSGTLNFDPVTPGNSSVDVKIKIASISTGVSKLDEHLIRSGEFFDAQAFPNITFRSTSVAPTAGRTAHVTGNLTINGVTKPVTLNVRWNFSGAHPLGGINPAFKEIYVSGFSATTQILRSDWGLSRTVPFISDELRITIETELHRKQVTSPQLPPETAGGSGPVAPGTAVGPQAPGLRVPEPGEPAPLPPGEGGPPHATTPPPPAAGTPPPANDAYDGAVVTPPSEGAVPQPTAPSGSPAGEPLDPIDGFGDQKIDNAP
jgi:polyisoprenoid-binding protein YceI